MKIYTKTGDNKETSIIGQRINKGSLRIESYGITDEALAYIGLIAAQNKDQMLKEQLDDIIILFFKIGNDLASIEPANYLISAADSSRIEDYIDVLSASLPELTSFIGPQGTDLACYCNIARAIIRRSERAIIRLSAEEAINEEILKLINRLSDYFFILMRYNNARSGYTELKINL